MTSAEWITKISAGDSLLAVLLAVLVHSEYHSIPGVPQVLGQLAWLKKNHSPLEGERVNVFQLDAISMFVCISDEVFACISGKVTHLQRNTHQAYLHILIVCIRCCIPTKAVRVCVVGCRC